MGRIIDHHDMNGEGTDMYRIEERLGMGFLLVVVSPEKWSFHGAKWSFLIPEVGTISCVAAG